MAQESRELGLPAAQSLAATGVPAGDVKERWRRLRLPVGLILPALLVALWEVLCQRGVFPPWQLPAPSYIFWTLVDLHTSGDLYYHSWASIRRVFLGFALGGGLGLLIGALVGLFRGVERVIDPTLQAIKSVPSLAWVPLLVLWFGIQETSKLTLIAIGAFFPVYVNLVAGIRGVDRKLVEVGQTYNLSRPRLLSRIILPATLPSFFTGFRVGLTQAWLFMVIAELMAASEGLGFLLTTGRELARPDLLMSSLVLLALLGKVTDSGVRALERRLLAWRDTFSG